MKPDNQLDPLQLLMSYQAACRHFDVEAATAFFSESGTLEFAGGQVTGHPALLEAHRWDRAARNQVSFLDPALTGDHLTFTFLNQHELHRLLGVEPIRSPAEMVIRDGRIHLFRLSPPEPASLQGMRAKAGPFFAWVREHHSDTWQRVATLDEAGGQALYDLAQAWHAHTSASA